MANIKPWLKALNFNEIQKDNLFELEINSHKIEEILKYMIDASDEEITYKETNTKLDHIFLSNHTEISNFETIENNFSDHKALLVNFFI